jgi:diguanylate cyclase (GGDEF)-like protein
MMRRMRRTQFTAAAKGKPAKEGRSSIRDLITCDLKRAFDPDEIALAERRVTSFNHAPMLLAAGHLVWGVTLLAQCVCDNFVSEMLLPALLLVLLLAVDGAFALLMRIRSNFQPHLVTRAICGFLAATGILWLLFVNVAHASQGMPNEHVTNQAIGAGLIVTALAAVPSPIATITNVLVAIGSAALLVRDPILTASLVATSLAVIAYSIANARSVASNARHRRQLDEEARKALHFVHEFEGSGRGWFWETNHLGTLSYVSHQLADDFHCSREELLGRQFTDLLSVDTSQGNGDEEHKTLGFHLSARFPFAEVVVRAATNEDIHWSLSGNPIFDEQGRFLGFRGIGTDLTEQRRSEQEISRLARFDSLTGLPNRAMMRQTLDEALRNASRRQKGCALFLIDLDRFKNVNDTLGHPVGDALLRQVSERLKSVMGNHGQVGRLGGDEFKAVLPGIVETGLLESLARTLIEQVSRPYTIEGHKVTIGASVGIAIGDPGRACADAMVRNADLALYAAKAAGRGKHCFYEQSMHSEASDRQVLENDLRQALDRGELWVAYQPIVRTTGEDVCGFEALVRWNHPARGPIGPDKFIPLAEECGMIEKIGAFVLRTAIKDAAGWPDSVRVAVNLSPIQFNNPNIVETVSAALNEHKFRSERLELEITEGVFLADSNATDETFANLKALGVRLALDDFGTGYSSLGYLKKAPFDKIKIDQSFVRGAASTGSRNSAIIRAIVSLAESLGMDTCAEGVETHDDLQLIRELGVSQVQGYIFGRPGDAATAAEFAAQATVEAEGFAVQREARQMLMRRAITAINGRTEEIRLRNISVMGALVECDVPVAPGTQLTLDIVGVGPVTGIVRWAHASRFGMQFTEPFDLTRLAPKREKGNDVHMLRPWYVDKAVGE